MRAHPPPHSLTEIGDRAVQKSNIQKLINLLSALPRDFYYFILNRYIIFLSSEGGKTKLRFIVCRLEKKSLSSLHQWRSFNISIVKQLTNIKW